MRDDYEDWEEDFLNGQYSPFITKAMFSYQSLIGKKDIPSKEDLETSIYLSHLIEFSLHESNTWFKKSLQYLESLSYPLLKQNLNNAIKENSSIIEKILISSLSNIVEE